MDNQNKQTELNQGITERIVDTPDHPLVKRIYVLSDNLKRGVPIGIPYLSISRTNAYQRCEAQYYYKYELDLKEPKNSALLFGTQLHNAQESVLKNINYSKQEQREAKETEIIEEAVAVATQYEIPENMIWKQTYSGSKVAENPTTFRSAVIRGTIDMIPHWMTRNTVAIEQGYLLEWQDEDVLPLFGFCDYVEQNEDGSETVVDLKTSSAKKDRLDLALNIAMPLYASMRSLSENKNVTKVRYDNYVRSKEPKHGIIEETIEPRILQRVFNRSKDITSKLKTGIFTPRDEHIVCGTCPFYERCRVEFSDTHLPGRHGNEESKASEQDWEIIDQED